MGGSGRFSFWWGGAGLLIIAVAISTNADVMIQFSWYSPAILEASEFLREKSERPVSYAVVVRHMVAASSG